MPNGIYIFGGQGTGTTTLAERLSETLGYVHIDADATDGLPEARLRAIRAAMKGKKWVLSGDICQWGDSLLPEIDAIAFLVVPLAARQERLRKKAAEHGLSQETLDGMLASAGDYEEAKGGARRSYEKDCQWLKQAGKPVLRLFGEESTQEWVDYIML